ncbi:MAG: DUF192 domain-containing protein [Candidatus Gastranaerophilales bacterium]|nr:DUF192 domain-containing protein [Candidatus Gastranaerophilales bacterium]
MKLINKTNGQVLADKLEIANTPFRRMKGLLGREKLEDGEGLHIIPCNNIHSFFMKFVFDAIFIDKKNKIRHLVEKMPPGRVSRLCFTAHSVVELPPGTICSTGSKIGDELEFVNQ